MTIFDVIPFLGRKASQILVIGAAAAYLLFPAATTRFVQSQFEQLDADITQQLISMIPPTLSAKPTTPQLRPEHGPNKHAIGGRQSKLTPHDNGTDAR